ncbi:MAG: tRNA uridine-5-carboxymethylaminomethyl(34) synthesis GTPase MnmE [Crocinitomicaceae bacterium]|nr:tRNA uridine-5-carboxymethylaminomethyl(34) synthesis GTPase MnmE [Crocinitomicaceae bacterium]
MINSNDTICALSTPPGVGGIAVIRISGNDAFSIAQKVFSRPFSQTESHRTLYGWILEEQEKIDEVLLTPFKSPGSFTGEDTVEIACHGSAFIQQRLLEILVAKGCRIATPGEYTLRAFLNGKMDLSQAEAVGDLIASESAAAHRQALHQMRGGFSKEINVLRNKLIHFASLIELELDFAEEDVEFANRSQLRLLVEEIEQVVNHLRDSFHLGNAIRNGVPVAITGAPNMGKSTLLNALLNDERAIVSDIAGTTRDSIEDYITIEGVRFRFIDTAGIRDTEDTIEKMGIERSFAKAREADIVLLLFDAVETSRDELLDTIARLKKETINDQKLILIANKMDKGAFNMDDFQERVKDTGEVIAISAKEKTDLDKLKSRLIQSVHHRRINSGETIVTNARHHAALCLAGRSLHEILNGMDAGVTGDFLAVDIRKTLYHLSEITGQINADDLLNSIFSKFCIGK